MPIADPGGLADSDLPSSGETFAGYRILRELGSGAFGSVYLAQHPRLPRLDAIKVMKPDWLALGRQWLLRFRREAEFLASLSHPNIVTVYDVGEEGGRPWFAMQYIPGVDAGTAVKHAGGGMPAERAVHLLAPIADALDYAHGQHILHRDIKPGNFLLAPSHDGSVLEKPYLTDFGIALQQGSMTRLTSQGATLGSWEYSPPEQFEAKPLDQRSDVYSLGASLYHLLMGEPPFRGEYPALYAQHLQTAPPRPSISAPWLPSALDGVIAKAMAKSQDDRYASCAELAEDALRALTHGRSRESPTVAMDAQTVPHSDAKAPIAADSSTEAPTAAESNFKATIARESDPEPSPEFIVEMLNWMWGQPMVTVQDLAREYNVNPDVVLKHLISSGQTAPQALMDRYTEFRIRASLAGASVRTQTAAVELAYQAAKREYAAAVAAGDVPRQNVAQVRMGGRANWLHNLRTRPTGDGPRPVRPRKWHRRR